MNRIFILLFALLLPATWHAQDGLDACLDKLGKSLALKLTSLEKTHVAVSDLVTLAGDSNLLGMTASEELTVALVHHALGFEVMDRSHLKAIFAEHRMALGGLMNEESLIELGRLESVDVIVTGTIAQLSDRYKITVKALDTETASLLAADRAYCARTPDLDAAFTGAPVGTVPLPDPDPDPKPVPVVDCATYKTGALHVTNHADRTVTLHVKAECGTTQTHALSPGETMTMNGLCAGLVQWSASGADWRKAGSVFIHACEQRKVQLTP